MNGNSMEQSIPDITTNRYYHFHDYSSIFSHLWGEHVSDAIDRSSEHQAPHQEAEEHHVGEEGAKVHHLREKTIQHLTQCCHGHALWRPLEPHTLVSRQHVCAKNESPELLCV